MARYDFSDLYDNKTVLNALIYQQGCAVCSSKDRLLRCEGCKLVHYCGAAHQKEHQKEHKKACDAINKSRQVFQNEEAETLAPDNDSYFDDLWGFRTQAYIKARKAVADALLKINTRYAVNAALGPARYSPISAVGDVSVATSNRAELRAVIAALRLYDWGSKGYKSIVIATDSSYVVNGATSWVKGWVRNGWKTRTGKNVKNKDLWDMLFGEVEKWKDQGQSVAFWKIPRELNLRADAAAKRAAADGAAEEEFKDVLLSPAQDGHGD